MTSPGERSTPAGDRDTASGGFEAAGGQTERVVAASGCDAVSADGGLANAVTAETATGGDSKADRGVPADDVPDSTASALDRALPAWVALMAAWIGLLTLLASVVFVALPGSVDPQAELQGLRPFSAKDRFLPVPVYLATVGLFAGIVVLHRMRPIPQPLPSPLVIQRMQAWVGIGLSILGVGVVYAYVHFQGPR